MKTTARTMGLALLAGTTTLGMSACTQVEGGASQATSAANSAAPSVASAASSAAGEATSAAPSGTLTFRRALWDSRRRRSSDWARIWRAATTRRRSW